MARSHGVVVGVALALSLLSGTTVGASADPVVLDRSDDGVWAMLDVMPERTAAEEAWIRPEAGIPLTLSDAVAERALASAPIEFEEPNAAPAVLSLPNPEGGFGRFAFVETRLMHPDLQAKFPDIRTYIGQGIDDPAATARVSMTPNGFAAQVFTTGGAYYVDRASKVEDGTYFVYAREGYQRPAGAEFTCLCGDPNHHDGHGQPAAGEVPTATAVSAANARVGEQLRTYRLAVSTTGEYAQFHGGTVSGTLSEIVNSINRVTGIYEREVAVRFQLVANNDQIIYLNGGTDPFSNGSAFSLINENQGVIDSVIGSNNYDVGHNYSTGGGGLASLGVVCVNGSKARGITGLPSPIGDPFYVDYVAHELGHQFRANHTFNGVNGSCSGGNRNGATAYEPGSATTIMGYAGICGADNVQSNSDPIFHSISFDEIRAFITSGAGNNCDVLTNTGNLPPTVEAGPNFAIPVQTSFELTATGSDPNGDSLTYAWEQRDLGPAAALTSPDNGQSPLFRSFDPVTSPSRTFPRLSTVLAGNVDNTEKLPTQTRAMSMRVTARDNRAGGGGVAFDEMTLSVTASAGPFRVTSPSQGDTFGGTQAVTWDVNSTDSAPINTQFVDILLSTDNGQTFPTTLASNTPNDGSEIVQFPAGSSSNARIKIVPINNVYFAISERFDIETPLITLALSSPAPGIVDAGVPTPIEVVAADGTESVVPGSVKLFTQLNGGSFSEATLTSAGGDLYTGALPGLACDVTLEYYVEARGSGGAVVRVPENAPADLLSTIAGEFAIAFDDDFQTNTGWSVSGTASDGQWQRGVPVNGDRGDPPADFDGSGQCYVTDNVSGNSDVDGGQTTLTSPVLDTTGGATITWAYWLNDIPTGALGAEDSMIVQYSPNGSAWFTVSTYNTASSNWRTDSYEVPAPGSPNARIRFTIADNSPGDVVEGGVDAVTVSAFTCEDPVVPCPEDLDGSGSVDLADLLQLLASFGAGNGGDVDGDGDTELDDLLSVLAAFGTDCP